MNEIINSYATITLDEMSGIRLMNRTDTKFVTTIGQLRRLLKLAAKDYRVQIIGDQRVARYYTLYFDTTDADMYHVHLTGKQTRQKLRIRSYVDSNLSFLEVKNKNNKRRTKKKRITIDYNSADSQAGREMLAQNGGLETYNEFLSQYLRYKPCEVHERLETRFNRITLVNNGLTERLTIDMNLRVNSLRSGRGLELEDIVIIELKRDGSQFSPILAMLNELRIKPMGFSKYCMGMALTEDIKKNRFKPRLRTIARMQAAERESKKI